MLLAMWLAVVVFVTGTIRISLAIDAREGYEVTILFYNCKTSISESVPI